jgi:hypothetical protein
MQATLFKLLRERGVITSGDLGAAMLAHFGLTKPTKAQAYAMRQRASQCVQRNARRGLIQCVGGIGKASNFGAINWPSFRPENEPKPAIRFRVLR